MHPTCLHDTDRPNFTFVSSRPYKIQDTEENGIGHFRWYLPVFHGGSDKYHETWRSCPPAWNLELGCGQC